MKMPSGVRDRRFGMWLLVCLLICSTFALAVQAKRSQYHSQTARSSYLAQATKMSEGRAPQLDAVEQLPQVTVEPRDTPVVWIHRALEPPRPKIIFFLDSFQFRPPPPGSRS
jgi:hypothetical protein